MSSSLDTDLIKRLKQALTAPGDNLREVLHDSSAEVLHALLKNVSLNEDHLIQLLQRRDLTSSLLKSITKHKLSQNLRITVAIIRNPAISPALVKQLMGKVPLFELLNLCTLPGQSADIRIAAEHTISQRLPQEPLGNKISLARRATATLLLPLLKEGHPQIVEASLDNPRLQESSIFQFLSSSGASAQTISAVARHPRWCSRKNLQRAILKNRHTPQVWYIHFLPKLPMKEAQNLLYSSRLHSKQKVWIKEFLDQR
ncbi:MAG: hypothetical protein U9R29_03090 [Thermodesulfobacteriota bacterium]|nr:hypothetical protein [Thermodesulfobacteriota bacterium]